MRLSPKDKRVINDFIDRKSIGSHSRRLVTDGHTLDIYGLGGKGVAEWRELGGGEGWKIIFRDLGRKDQEVIQRYIRKTVSPRWLESGESNPSRDARRTTKAKALAALERAWIQHHRGGSAYARHGGERVHNAMDKAMRAGATQADINRVMDRAASRTEQQREQRYRKQLARRDPAYSGTSPAYSGTSPAYSGTSPAYRGTSRSKSPRADVLITRKKYKRTNGVKVKKTKYKVKSRDLSRGTRDPQPNINPVCPVGTQVQSVILSQQFFNQREAASWIRRNGFRLSKIDESANFWRFRQQPPSQFEEGTFRTIRLRPGVEAVIGCPR